MPNQIRPCTLPAHWKQTEPFDAIKIGTFLYRPVPYHTQTKKKTEYRIELFINDSDSIFSPPARDKKELEQYKFEAITTIAEALNAPVLATEEVLAGLPEGGVFYIQDKDGERRLIEKNTRNKDPKTHRWQHRGRRIEDVGSPHRIVGGDAMSQEYLRQFTLDGVRIKEGG